MILETELEPALTVEADALSRLGMEIEGRRVQNVFAVTVPRRLRSASRQRLFYRVSCYYDIDPSHIHAPNLSGSFGYLCDHYITPLCSLAGRDCRAWS